MRLEVNRLTLRSLMSYRGLNVAGVVSHTRVPRATFQGYVSGRVKTLSLDHCRQVASALSCTVDDLINPHFSIDDFIANRINRVD